MTPRFSIVIPTFNRGEELTRCIDSIVSTSFTNYEIIVVDDGSTDNTADLIENRSDSNILYHRISNSGGPARPRNIGLKLSRAEFVLFVDCDDEFVGERLFFLDGKVNLNYDIYYHDVDLFENGSFLKTLRSRIPTQNVFHELVNRGNFIYTSSVCVRRNAVLAIGGFNETIDFKSVEDYDLWLRLAKGGYKFFYLKGAYIKYNHDGDSISKQPVNALKILNLLRHWRAELPDKEYKRMKARSFYYAASIYYHNFYYVESYRIFKLLLLRSLYTFDIVRLLKYLVRTCQSILIYRFKNSSM